MFSIVIQITPVLFMFFIVIFITPVLLMFSLFKLIINYQKTFICGILH